MELWSLMHFLMPTVFESNKEFKDWFVNPMTSMIEGETEVNDQLIGRLHGILRPFLLRRLKKDVEKQLPNKFEHVVLCRLSKRQRFLYEEFLASSNTKSTLTSGNFLGIVNVLMQLRKVCNHPDLFEARPIVSPYDMERIFFEIPSLVYNETLIENFYGFENSSLNLQALDSLLALSKFDHLSSNLISASQSQFSSLPPAQSMIVEGLMDQNTTNLTGSANPSTLSSLARYNQSIFQSERNENEELFVRLFTRSQSRLGWSPIYGNDLISFFKSILLNDFQPNLTRIAHPTSHYSYSQVSFAEHTFNNYMMMNSPPFRNQQSKSKFTSSFLVSLAHEKTKVYGQQLSVSESIRKAIILPVERANRMDSIIERFVVIIPKARAPTISIHCSHPLSYIREEQQSKQENLMNEISPLSEFLRPAEVRSELYFPDKRLLQYDCGKLQQLSLLLRALKDGGHRVLIFTQMTRMLDIFETFLSFYGYTYVRLDGTTKVERRQQLMERFNRDPKVFVFILSTRSGGIGINLTGADTVIFYDSDWNPSMDAQAQDRCHRIGQTREVHIYRLISQHTIEENILKKANQKRQLENMAITSGGFTTDFFKRVDIRELVAGEGDPSSILPNNPNSSAPSNSATTMMKPISEQDWVKAVSNFEEDTDKIALQQVQKEVQQELEDFSEEQAAAAQANNNTSVSTPATNQQTNPTTPAPITPAASTTNLNGNGSGKNEEDGKQLLSLEDASIDKSEGAPPPQIQLATASNDLNVIDSALTPIQR